MTLYDLTQPVHEDVPHSTAHPSPELETIRTVEEDGANVQRYCAGTHVGTHVDAPIHFVPGGETIDELPLEQFDGPAVVVDLDCEEPGEVSLDAFRAAADDAGGIRDGDIVLVRTGWGRYYDDEETYRRYPWLAAEVADWLVDRGVTFLGVDTISPDRPREMRPEGWDDYPVHRTLLPEGILIAEHLFLEPVAGRRLTVSAFPVKFQGGDGAPIRVVGRDGEE